MKILKRLFLSILLICCACVGLGSVPQSGKGGLIVVISVDQFRPDYLVRFAPYFGKDGFKRFTAQGAVYTQAAYRHAVTFTGPGHAAIGTGYDPMINGIVANRWVDIASQKLVYCVEDPQVQILGVEGKSPSGRSPVNLTGEGIGDRLKEKFSDARVVSIALKDRAAILMGGKKADAVLWYDDSASKFVTSTYYPRRPDLLEINSTLPAFFTQHKSWDLTGFIPEADWSKITFDPDSLMEAKNPDSGMGATFPHPISNPESVIQSPFGNDALLMLAHMVIEKMKLGRNSSGNPDLMFIGFSSPDYYGHMFGPDSREVADGTLRLDRQLQSFFAWLDEQAGRDNLLMFLTADHGITAIPEVAAQQNFERTGKKDPLFAGRYDLDLGPTIAKSADELVKLEQSLASKFGYQIDVSKSSSEEGAVLTFSEPYLYLNRQVLAKRHVSIENVKNAARDWLKTRTGVSVVYTNTEISNVLPADAPYGDLVRRSFRADRSGDLYIALRNNWIWGAGKGTTHGEPTEDDRRVPLLAWGPNIKAGNYADPVSPLAIAKTIAAIYGLSAGAEDVAPLKAAAVQP